MQGIETAPVTMDFGPELGVDPLRDSIRIRIKGVEYKSCPCCSQAIGKAVFKQLDEFGERQINPGVFILQSWCKQCR